jgi:hypothetical protein
MKYFLRRSMPRACARNAREQHLFHCFDHGGAELPALEAALNVWMPFPLAFTKASAISLRALL